MAQQKQDAKKRKAGYKAGHPAGKKRNTGGSKLDQNNKSGGEPTSAANQKRALKQERQSHRKHAEIVVEAKKIWNQLRQKNNSKDAVCNMMDELMTLIRGKVNEIALQHDASRVVQAALQFGTDDQRTEIIKELCKTQGNLFELARNQYAHFVVLKAIKYCASNEESVRLIVKALKGHIPKLAVQASGSKVIEAMFRSFPAKSTAAIKQEFYGPHFSLFASDVVVKQPNAPIPDLASHLQSVPDKKDVALDFIRPILNKGIEKSFFGYTYFQDLFAEYVAAASPNDVRAVAPSVVDHAVHLLSSKTGAQVVAYLAAYGTAKDRKRIMKSLKGFTCSALLHQHAYIAVLRLVQVTDDTVSIQKNIFNEILTRPDTEEDPGKPPLLEIALNDRACKLFRMLLVSDELAWKKLFDPLELTLLDPNPTVSEGGEEVPTSKKNPDARRLELLQHLQKPLTAMCVEHTRELLLSLSGSVLIRDLYNACRPEELVGALGDVCVSALDEKTDDQGRLPLFEDRVGHLAIKHLLQCDIENETKTSPCFAVDFFEKLKTRLDEVAKSNRGAFLVLTLCKTPAVGIDAVKTLKQHTRTIKKHSTAAGNAKAGYEALLKVIENE